MTEVYGQAEIALTTLNDLGVDFGIIAGLILDNHVMLAKGYDIG